MAETDMQAGREAIRTCFDSSNFTHHEWWENGYRLAYGDGSCVHPDDHRLSRAGSGVFFGPQHPGNLAEATPGDVQNSYAAELYAALIAIENTKQSFALRM